jgi:hypothetical protein
MTTIIIVLDEEGVFQQALTDSEVNFKVLTKGKDDAAIDQAEAELDVIE